MKKRILFFISLFAFIPNISLISQISIDLRQTLTEETYKIWDAYIIKYAPADSAFRVVETIAQRHFISQRAAVSRFVYQKYRSVFPQYDSLINFRINAYEQIMLTQTPARDMFGIYNEYIIKNAPTDNAFLAVQSLAYDFVNKKMWDSALIVYNTYKQYFPQSQNKFNSIINILNSPFEGLKINNLGPEINTSRSEWDPTPTPDSRFLYFTADQRPGGNGQEDIWVSELKNGKWQKAKNLGKPVNNINNETIDNVSVDGTTLLMSGDFTGTYGEFDIYFAEMDSINWKLIHLPYPINTQYHEESGNLTSDGKALLFTSDRPGGIGVFMPINKYFYHGSTMGNMDIYISFLSDTGWSVPINLGSTINTPYSERAAYLHPDGKTLYFSSNGHAGLGRLDVYKSVRLKEDSWTEWSEPVNLGKEINTANDDWGYSIDIKGDSAFFAINDSPDGYGNWDIYSVTLPKNAKPDKVIVVRGKVTDSKSNPLGCIIKWEDLETGEVIGRLRSDPRDGNYFIALKPGKNYGYFAEKSGFYPVSKNIDLRINVNDKEINEDIILISNNELKNNKSVIINNIFFDYNKFDLKSESIPELNRLADFLKNNSEQKIIIEGHTDDSGSNEYNQKLSEDRAESIMKYLINQGIQKNRISTKGFGKTKPLAPNVTEENREKNRRVEFRFG